MRRRWLVKPKAPEDFLKKFPDFHPVILQLLYNRGLMEPAAHEVFFRPSFEGLGSPFELSDMREAVARILQAVDEDERITIYADYDADAVTACAVLFRTLSGMGARVDSYIPDRFTEGYGVNADAVREIAERGSKLIVTVDCGINSAAEAALAARLEVDMVITDHHEIIGELPVARAVVNPKRNPELSGLSGLTGVGVAFKLASALLASVFAEDYAALYGWKIPGEISMQARKIKSRVKLGPQWEKWLLDLVAIGTVADCQSLLGENRILVKYGLRVLKKTKWPGLRSILRNAGIEDREEFDTFDIGFIIAPRINAAGRIQHADIAFKLLSTNELSEATMYAGQLESLNAHRQRLTEQIVSEAKAQVLPQAENRLLVAVGDNWPKGVVGLVASRLVEEFSRPALVLERGAAVATGSARSYGGFNMVKAFAASSQHLERFGGHAQAAGLTLKNENIAAFHESLLAFAEKHLSPDEMVKNLEIDLVLEPKQVDDGLVEKLEAFEPYGPGNPSVNFLIKNLSVEQLKTVGATNKHLKLHASSGGKILEFIGFNHGFRQASLRPGDLVDIVAEPSHNHWNGRRRIQLKVLDILKK